MPGAGLSGRTGDFCRAALAFVGPCTLTHLRTLRAYKRRAPVGCSVFPLRVLGLVLVLVLVTIMSG